MRRGFRDRDFVRTKEGFFFCVVGPLHPPDRVISYIKYIPAPNGRWIYRNLPLKRVLKNYTIPSLLETLALLRERHPHYMFFSEVYGIEMSGVPLDLISKHYLPEKKLSVLFNMPKPDELQRLVVELVSLISERIRISRSDFGATGSILLDIHNPKFSDIDLTIYGRKSSSVLKTAFKESLIGVEDGISRLEREELKVWCKRKTERYPLTLSEALTFYRRKWHIGKFKGTNFSIHPVKLEGEIEEKYADKVYKPLGEVTIRATVSGDLDSPFLPAVYKVEDVEIIQGVSTVDVVEVVSYESLYADIASEGETVEARGKLEEVMDKRSGKIYYRVLVGSPQGGGGEYIKPILH